jgi:hypothetical protein
MGITQQIEVLRRSVAQDEKLVEDFDLMQAQEHANYTDGAWLSTTYAMWGMLEQCAYFAEKRKNVALGHINHLLARKRRER